MSLEVMIFCMGPDPQARTETERHARSLAQRIAALNTKKLQQLNEEMERLLERVDSNPPDIVSLTAKKLGEVYHIILVPTDRSVGAMVITLGPPGAAEVTDYIRTRLQPRLQL